MRSVFLSLGSNQGDRCSLLVEATKRIDNLIGEVKLFSAIFESEPWGFSAEVNFYNLALLVETGLTPRQVLSKCLEIEKKLGRVREGTVNSSRLIDIDMLFFDEMLIDDNDLVIPHPRLHLRKFVLEPLVMIAPDFIHPVINKSIAELLHETEDNSLITMILPKYEFGKFLKNVNLK